MVDTSRAARGVLVGAVGGGIGGLVGVIDDATVLATGFRKKNLHSDKGDESPGFDNF